MAARPWRQLAERVGRLALVLLLVLTAVLAAGAHKPPPAKPCSEQRHELNTSIRGEALNAVLPLLTVDLSGQKFTLENGVVLTVRKVRELAWKGGLVGKADVDFDHESISGSGTLPLRLSAELDATAQILKPRVSLTGPIEIQKSQLKGMSASLGSLAESGLTSLIRAVSETEEFRSEFSRRAEEYAKPINVQELVSAVRSSLGKDFGCIASAKLDELTPSADALSLRGSAVTCCR